MQCWKWKSRSAGILFESETRTYRQKNVKIYIDTVYIDKYRYEIQVQKEVQVWYIGLNRLTSSTA
jgi:hypothetical protein